MTLCRSSASKPGLSLAALLGTLSACHLWSLPLAAQNDADAEHLEHVKVIGISPAIGGMNTENLPFAVQVFSKEDLHKSGYYSVVSMLGESAGSVSTNAAQNNRLQPDIQFRGFTASPLLGLPQGIAVYQNGVRVNEVFGDTVNWDLLPASTVQSMNLVAGSNPVFGLNALGGAITISTRTGFSSPGSRVAAGVGSDSAREVELSSGGNNGEWGYYIGMSGMEEDGWRDHSESDAYNLYGALSWRSNQRELDLFFSGADTELRGNGSVPQELMEQDRKAVFTHPDITENDLQFFSLSYRQWFGDDTQLNVTAFSRRNETDSFNGDGSEFEECDPPEDGFLCDDDEQEMLEDHNGNPVSVDWNAINNRSNRDQHSAGLTGQWIQSVDWGGLEQQLVFGADYFDGHTDFVSSVEFAALTEDRGTSGSGLYHEEGRTLLDSDIRTISAYASDMIGLSERFNLTLSARYNDTRIESEDPSGENVDLEGDHSYTRLNSGVGATYLWNDNIILYSNLQQTSRTPSPVELACSHEEAPCNLPNSFLADPPLDDVVSLGGELGLRGAGGGWLDKWRLGLFHTTNRDDIIFQTTGGVSSSEGFFTNAADTLRKGVELELSGRMDRFSWYGYYTWLQATFEDSFTSSSPNHPGAGEEGMLLVNSGNDMPGLPDHNLKLGIAYDFSDRLTAGLGMLAYSGQYLRGDEANLDDETAGYGIVNFYGSYRPTRQLELQFKVDNLFDKEYESFGLYGEADEVLEDIENESNRFLGPGAPRQFWITVSYNW